VDERFDAAFYDPLFLIAWLADFVILRGLREGRAGYDEAGSDYYCASWLLTAVHE